MNAIVLLVIFATLLGFSFLLLVTTRYRRCPSNQILVVYGKVGGGQSSKCLHGGGAFIWPLIQNYAYLSLEPVQIEIPLSGALSAENIRVNVPSNFTVAIGVEPELMNAAAVRLLGLNRQQIVEQARDIIFGQLRQVIAGLKIENINKDRDTFRESIKEGLEPELRKIGLVLINVNITDITDESGYIEAIGRKAASEAVQQAVIDVAEQQKRGAIGVAEAERERAVSVSMAERDRQIGVTKAQQEQAIEVANLERDRVVGEQKAANERESSVKEAEREKRVRVANADAHAVEGENQARARVVATNADLQVKEAEARQRAETKRREAEAAVLQAQYAAETLAALEFMKKREAEQRADVEATAKAEKAKTVVDAEAAAERVRIDAEAQAGATYARLSAQARGEAEILQRKAEALRSLVEAAGGADKAFQLMMLEHVDHLADTASSAIQNIKFDKIVVWEGGRGDGKGSTSEFLRSLAGALPPVMHMVKDIGGIDLPEALGRIRADDGGPKRNDEPTPPARPSPPKNTRG
ncbi:MAG: flotillin family protein [Myxococcales bacterium]|nr:flotillin family protein [Myxococcales bacterium]